MIPPVAPTSLTAVSSPRQAAAAYGASTDMLASGSAAATAAGPDFASMVGKAASSAINTVRQSERVSALGVAGKADVQDVVQAVSDAEVTVQAVVGIRDKVVGAYNDVLRMTV